VRDKRQQRTLLWADMRPHPGRGMLVPKQQRILENIKRSIVLMRISKRILKHVQENLLKNVQENMQENIMIKEY
jgi:hypothetical protein